MNSDLPIIFLAFAQERQEGRFLDSVVEEGRELREIFEKISAHENREGSEDILCELIIRPNATFEEIKKVFQSASYRDRIAIFHFGGHADGFQLMLESKGGKSQAARGEGLVSFLGRRKSLKLVFLNGCSTQMLAQDLVDNGVPAVIGTSTAISDDTAGLLSISFYKGLAEGLTLAGAWEDAKDEVKTLKEPEKIYRGMGRGTRESGRFPWDLAFKDDAAEEVFKNWNLPEEAKNPLFNLPPLKKTQLPANPFLFLKPYRAEHAEIFFGRSKYVRDLWLKIVEPNSPSIILLYGESGSGKSSLLDAGLRPRLEAAMEDGKPRFEIKYERREQEKGLVRTLADMLSYSPEQQTEQEVPDMEIEKAPNLEKIQAIESLASELEEETANTFQAIINRYKALQGFKPSREDPSDLYLQMQDEKGTEYLQLDKNAGLKLREAWIKMEQQTGRPLIIILDQVEECFTQDNTNKIKNELVDLLQVLKVLFDTPTKNEEEKIQGKIILGYREEFNAKILARFKDFELSRSAVFLEQLQEEDIKDIFRQLQSGKIKSYYNIRVDTNLPSQIATDLLKGRSAVAPVLQLLLTKLWENTHDEKTNSANFTVDVYNKIQSGGKEMEKYFLEQMELVQQWNQEVVESGLVLDILKFHVSPLGTSRRQNFIAIYKRYKHLEEEYDYSQGFLEKLINKLKSPEIFLLNDEGRGFTSLPHDTLAPIIRREYDRSDKLGQRSTRIMEIKGPDLKRVEEKEDELKKLRLNDIDLEIVEEGKKGMRGLDKVELRLLEISLEERRKRLRSNQRLIKVGIVAGLFILVLIIFAGILSLSMVEELNKGVIAKAHDASLIEQNKNPDDLSKAIQLAQFAYQRNNTRRVDVVNNLYRLHEKANLQKTRINEDSEKASQKDKEPPLSIFLKPGSKIDALDYPSSFGPFLTHFGDTLVKYWPEKDMNNGQPLTIHLGENSIEHQKVEVGFTANGEKIQALSYSYREPLYLMRGELVDAPWMQIFSPNVDNDIPNYPIGYFDFFAGKFVDKFGRSYLQDEFIESFGSILDPFNQYNNLQVTSIDGYPINLDTLFSFKLMEEESGLLDTKLNNKLHQLGNIWNLQGNLIPLGTDKLIPLRKTNLTRVSYNSIRVWDPDKSIKEPEQPIYFETGLELFFLKAISNNLFLVVNPDQQFGIMNTDDGFFKTLLPPEELVLDLAISPDHQYIFALTRDNAFIWNLAGNPVIAYPHKNIKDFSFSLDGSHLLTVSADSVLVWSSANNDKKPIAYMPLDITNNIAMARFHQNSKHIVIALVYAEAPTGFRWLINWLKRFFSSSKKEKKKDGKEIKTRIVYRNFLSGQNEIFDGPDGGLHDATVSENGNYAVALQSGRATVIPSKEERFSPKNKTITTIEVAASKKILGRKTSKVMISPGGKYIVKQSSQGIELFHPNGKLANAYSFQNGFLPGFNGQLFTPDDHYLISNKSDELLFLHPNDEKLSEKLGNYELSLEDKFKYELNTIIDDIPGTEIETKWWAVGVIPASLIFILLYFSDFIIQFIKQKKYLELGLYFTGFLLFSLILIIIWAGGKFEPELRRVAFYSIVWATLALLVVAMFRSRKMQKPKALENQNEGYWEQLKNRLVQLPKYSNLISLGLVAMLVLFGSVKFLIKETRQQKTINEKNEEINLKLIKQNYQIYSKGYANSSPDGSGSIDPVKTADQKLTLDQYKIMLEDGDIDSPISLKPKLIEWPYLLFGLLIPLLFMGLIGRPIHLIIKKYRAGDLIAFYRWLLWPVAFLIGFFWIAYVLLFDDGSGDSVASLLTLVSGVLFLGVAIRQSRIYYKGNRYAAIGSYAFLVGSILLLLLAGTSEAGLSNLASLFILALPASYILRRQYLKQGAFKKAFLLFCSCIFLVFGVISWFTYSENVEEGLAILGGLFLLTPLLTLAFYLLNRQVKNIYARRAASKWVLLNWLAIVGLWWLVTSFTVIFTGALIDSTYNYEDNFEEDFYPEEGTLPAEAVVNPSIDDETLEEELESSPVEISSDGPENDGQENMLESLPVAQTPAPVPVDFSATLLNNRQRLIIKLFDPNEITRDRARINLETYWKNDQALIHELIQYSYENPDRNEGIRKTIDLLTIQSERLLRINRNLLGPYLEWASQKEYEGTTIQQIQNLQNSLRE